MTVTCAHILAVLGQDETSKEVGVVLQNCSHRVTLAATFSEAMKILQNDKIDLIIADIGLQDDESDYSNFFDLLRWVKGDPLLRSISFICLSLEPVVDKTYLDGLRIAARSLGAARFLTMEHFGGSLLIEEIDSLIPKDE